MRSHTNCEWTDDERVRGCFCTFGKHHPLAICTQMMRHSSDRVHQVTSRTHFSRTNDETASARDSAPLRADHVLSAGGQMMGHGQQWIWQLSDEITHSLWAGRRRETVSDRCCSSQMRSRTSYRWTEAIVSDGFCTSQMRSRTNCRWRDDGTLSTMVSAALR